MIFKARSEDDLKDIAKQWISQNPEPKVYLFNGDMGAGKTTFIRALCEELGIQEAISSPTFSLVNEYRTSDQIIYHFDLYRLNNINELYDLGFEEYLSVNAYVFIEWPQIGADFYPDNTVKVNISLEDSIRTFSFE